MLAQLSLGVKYLTGQGVGRDIEAGIHWLTKSAGQGSTDSMLYLGILYADPQYGRQDFVEAYKWFFLASAHGVKIEKYKSYFENQITAEQVDLSIQKALELLIAKNQAQKENDAAAATKQ